MHDKDTGEIVFTMDAPFVYDAQNHETVAGVALTDCGEYVRMEYVIDEDYLNTAVSPTSGSQTLPADWTKATNTLSTANTGVKASSTDSSFPEALSGNYLAIEGAPDKAYVGFTQTYNLKGNKGDVYTVGGWANSHSLPKASGKYRFCLLLRLQKLDGSWSGYAVYDFNEEWVGWQFASFAAVAAENYQKIELTISYLYNCNISQFSNIFLHREAFGESYAYDDDKNLIAVGNLAGQKSKAVYDSAKNVTKYTQPGRDSSADENQYLAYYGNSDAERKKHLPWRTRTPMNMLDYFSYDDKGNITATSRVDYQAYTHNEPMTVNVGENDYLHIRTENTYTSDGNYTASTKDARGNTVTQTVNTSDGTLTSVKDPTNQTVNYTYDAAKRVTCVQTTGDGKTYRNTYTYENDRIKTVSHNTTSDTATDVTYTFAYDALGRKTTVKVGTQTLSTNVYANDRNGLLNEVQYGNGGKVKYSYDEFDRVIGVKYDAETADRYTYEYGANGQAAEVTDNNLNRVARTEYDLADRPRQSELRDDSGNVLYRTNLKYDKLNNLKQFAERVGSEGHTSDYAYDRDNRTTEIAYDGTAHKVGYTYDALGRMATRTAKSGVTAGKLTSSYSYVGGGYGTNSTTPLVAKITQGTPAGAAMDFEYECDTRGNIISEKRGSLTTTYAYDALGQLIRVNDPHDTTSGSDGTTWVYSYDRGGNILSKARYAYTTADTLGTALQTISYTYGDSNWKDKLTAYDGVTITYDEIGNPLSDGIWTYTWGAGRQLRQMSRTGMTVQFKYDHNGLRTQKMVTENGVTTTTNYVLHGKLITHMTRGTDSLHFFYDAQSRPTKVSFNGVMYTYVHNLQGDVTGILDNEGNLVVEYKYDAWGKPTGTISTLTTDLAYLNPFRYRGYVYDEETRLYYLRSRYYDAWIGRFVNSDNTTGQIGGTLNHNLFVYCKSVPVCCADPSGKSLISAILSLFQIKKAISKSGMKVTGRTIQTNKGNYSIYSPKPKGYAELWPQHFKLKTIAYGKSTIRVSSLYEFIKPLGKLELSNEDNYASPVATLFTGFVDYLSSVVEGSVYCTLETKIVQNGNNDSSAIMNMTVAQKVWNYSKGGYDDHQLGSVSILGFENGVVEIPIYNDRLGAFIVYSFSDEAGIMKALIEGMELEYY